MSRNNYSRNLPPEVKDQWRRLGKHYQVQYNAICTEQGEQAGLDYIVKTYADKYGAITPEEEDHHSDTASIEPEGKKKITALIPPALHRRLLLHSAVSGHSINQIVSQLIRDHVPDYEVTIRG
ncbi:MAG: hypothetical protein FIA89_10705 [Geobacter sp.]|nr:hypothetical protein [Geobacter sp.]